MIVATAEKSAEYEVFCALVQSLCAVDLRQYKRQQMERRVRTFARNAAVDSLESYGALLAADPHARTDFLDQLNINVSQLWRNPTQWETLARDVIPGLITASRLRAWCAGVSYGAEAYTLAAICRAVAPGAEVRILGTDIDVRMIAASRAGVFSERDARDAPPAALEAAFDPIEGEWHAHAELKSMIDFEVADLLTQEPQPGSFELIVCRNTVIYFEAPARDAVHERLARALAPGGCLVVGSSERVTRPGTLGLRPESPFVYRKAR